MKASDFASVAKTEFPFGVDEGRTATALRALADQIEARRVVVEQVQIHDTVRQDDFTKTTLTVVFHEKKP